MAKNIAFTRASTHQSPVSASKDLSMARPRPALGANLRRLRNAAKLTQHELADRSGVHRTVIGKIESGMQAGADLDTLEKLSRALGVSAGELIGDESLDLSGDEITPLVDEFLRLEAIRPVIHPTDEEIQWVREIPSTFLRHLHPSVESIGELIRAYRLRSSRGNR